VGVWAGDDSPSKRDRRPLFVPIRFSQCTRPRLLLLQEVTTKSAAPSALPRAWSDGTCSRQLSSSCNMPSLRHEGDHDI
jgi:hypothetical protein